jgi:hypothetical protein
MDGTANRLKLAKIPFGDFQFSGSEKAGSV